MNNKELLLSLLGGQKIKELWTDTELDNWFCITIDSKYEIYLSDLAGHFKINNVSYSKQLDDISIEVEKI